MFDGEPVELVVESIWGLIYEISSDDLTIILR